MATKTDSVTSSTLLLKNLPKDVDTLTEILVQLQPLPTEIKPFGRRRALLYYDNENDAKTGLKKLQGFAVQEREIKASLFRKNAVHKENVRTRAAEAAAATNRKRSKSTQTNTFFITDDAKMPTISNFVRQLYACNTELGFEQPPPPYLRYSYPRITPAILDSISIALMSNTRFYTQVLHLMNRMNLEPPFGPRTKKFVPPGELRESATQTDDVLVMEAPETVTTSAPPLAAALQFSEEESELETSGDEQLQQSRRTDAAAKVKRKQSSNEEQYKKKARMVLQAANLLKKSTMSKQTKAEEESAVKDLPTNLQSVFEAPAKFIPAKISVNLGQSKAGTAAAIAAAVAATPSPAFVPPSDYSTQRLSLEKLQELPIYRNYNSGEPSPKLYIKNLSKDVCAEDLRALYARFVPPERLDVKVMQQGRMKGQAFVTFNNVSDGELEAVVGLALRETNGFVLREKPMIVCFGRK